MRIKEVATSRNYSHYFTQTVTWNLTPFSWTQGTFSGYTLTHQYDFIYRLEKLQSLETAGILDTKW